MQIETALSQQVARYLDLAAAETKLTAANMANVDTPGFKAMGMDFEAEMRTALTDVEQGRASQAVRVRPEGNNVSMDRESLNLAEAQLKFKTGVAVLRQQYQMILDAIHADK